MFKRDSHNSSLVNGVNALKISFYVLIVILLGNTNAIVDAFIHPEIPYFDHEHIIVGSTIGIFSMIIGLIILYYISRLQKTNKEKESLIENLYKAKLKAEESDRLKSAFLANMSHEIRTPMSGIISFSNLLKEANLNQEQQKVSLDMIQTSGERMLNLINDILDISRIESGMEEIHRSKLDLNNQLNYILNLYLKEAQKKGIALEVRTSLPDEESVLNTDSAKFFSIMTNLVKNAIKYTEEGKIVFGYEINRTTEVDSPHLMLNFFVKDTGIGIPEERQHAIFDRFIQADIKDEQARQGVGLGLAISKAYVEMLGGKIWVTSNKDIGSTFWFQIPYVRYYPTEVSKNGSSWKKESLSEEPSVSDLHVMIVDDDETAEKYLSTVMADVAKKFYFANTGEKAVDICRKNSHMDLILMDIKMPVMNGYEATRLIRTFNKDVVIVAQTAYAFSEDKSKALAAGCNYYLTKPVAKSDLLKIIKEVFDN
ncbi:MAG: response regulator [Bacteroidales bacterium]|nr:response regulator [Bacteroidales bacterium]